MTAFNGARIETAANLNDETIGLGGGWVRTGNILGAGGGDKLGSKDNFGWRMIVANVTKGGFEDDGSFFIANGDANPERRHRQLIRNLTSNSNLPVTIFTKAIEDLTAYQINFSLVYLSDDGINWGTIKRSMTVFRDGGVLNNSKESFILTERVGNKTITAKLEISGTSVSIKFYGLAATNIKGSTHISFHGVKNP